MPIGNFLEKKEYTLGAAVQLQGNQMEGFTIIAQGRCKVILIVTHKRSFTVTEHVKGLKSKLPKFYFGKKGIVV